MAESRRMTTDKRKTSYRKSQTYVAGTAVRKLHVEELPVREREPQKREYRRREEKLKSLSIGYTLFLAAASALTLWVCAGYLQLQADNTARMKNIVALEAQLSELRTENDDEYNRVTTSVDLEEIREIAINELGMVYASADQVVLYKSEGSDYVKQYAEIPGEESSLDSLLSTISR